jgi:hypothetical protein
MGRFKRAFGSALGRRKYQCQRCQAYRMLRPFELHRTNIPVCPACGARWWEPYSQNAVNTEHELHGRAQELPVRGDLVKARRT